MKNAKRRARRPKVRDLVWRNKAAAYGENGSCCKIIKWLIGKRCYRRIYKEAKKEN
jgi:hypothetical protein